MLQKHGNHSLISLHIVPVSRWLHFEPQNLFGIVNYVSSTGHADTADCANKADNINNNAKGGLSLSAATWGETG